MIGYIIQYDQETLNATRLVLAHKINQHDLALLIELSRIDKTVFVVRSVGHSSDILVSVFSLFKA